MSRTHIQRWLTISVLALLAGTALATPAASVGEARYLLVLDTPEGIVEQEMTQSEVDATRTCGINAPEAVSCTNGPVTRISAAGHGLLLPIPTGFDTAAGNVPVKKMHFVSILSTSATERVFRCEVTQTPAPAGNGVATFACFPGSGSFPPVGASMTQTAYGLAHAQGGSADTTSYEVFKASGGDVVLPGLGKITAQLTY